MWSYRRKNTATRLTFLFQVGYGRAEADVRGELTEASLQTQRRDTATLFGAADPEEAKARGPGPCPSPDHPTSFYPHHLGLLSLTSSYFLKILDPDSGPGPRQGQRHGLGHDGT